MLKELLQYLAKEEVAKEDLQEDLAKCKICKICKMPEDLAKESDNGLRVIHN